MVVQRENLVGSGAGWSPSPRPSHTTRHAFYAPGGSSESLNLGSAKTRVLSFAASHSWRPFDIGDNVRLPPAKSGTSRSFLPSTRLVQDGRPCSLAGEVRPFLRPDNLPSGRSTMASADFSEPLSPEISHGQLTGCPGASQDLPLAATSSLGVSLPTAVGMTLAVGLLTLFLFVKTPFCIRLLSVLPSRAAPCLLLMIP
jgi:hypothetical protein